MIFSDDPDLKGLVADDSYKEPSNTLIPVQWESDTYVCLMRPEEIKRIKK